MMLCVGSSVKVWKTRTYRSENCTWWKNQANSNTLYRCAVISKKRYLRNNKMALASFVVLLYVAAAVILSWLYFRRYAMTRPPIGVFNLGDIAFMIGAIILVPFLYLLLPIWILASLLALASLSILYFTWEPVLRSAWMIWLITILLASADLFTALIPDLNPTWFFAVNNLVLVISVVGVTNLWAQSGMKARHAAILGAALSRAARTPYTTFVHERILTPLEMMTTAFEPTPAVNATLTKGYEIDREGNVLGFLPMPGTPTPSVLITIGRAPSATACS